MSEVLSPLTGTNKVELIETISAKIITDTYFNLFKIDISKIINDVETIYKYKCIESGYLFYYPFNIKWRL